MISLLEPLVDEFEDSPHWQLAARPVPAAGDYCANSLQRFDKPSSLSRRLLASDLHTSAAATSP
jgi:hypothetical protein